MTRDRLDATMSEQLAAEGGPQMRAEVIALRTPPGLIEELGGLVKSAIERSTQRKVRDRITAAADALHLSRSRVEGWWYGEVRRVEAGEADTIRRYSAAGREDASGPQRPARRGRKRTVRAVQSVDAFKDRGRFSRVPSWAPHARLSTGAKLRGETIFVLVALAKHADHEGRSRPGLDLLSGEAEVIRRNLHRNLRDLADAGLIRIHPNGSYTLLYFSPDWCSEPLSPETEPLSPETPRLTGDTRARRKQPIEQRIGADISLGAPSGVHIQAPIEVLFEEFWTKFPHRPGDLKRIARAVFNKIVRSGIEPALLIERAQAHAANIEGLDPRYWTTAHKWLAEECWSDQTVHPIRRRKSPAENLYAGFAAAAGFDSGGQTGEERAANHTPEVSDAEWRAILIEFVETNRLSSSWLAMFPGRGLAPQNAATRVPMHLRKEFGFA